MYRYKVSKKRAQEFAQKMEETHKFCIEKGINHSLSMDSYYFEIGGNDIDAIVESYRRYYRYKKKVLSKFEYYVREEPEWLK